MQTKEVLTEHKAAQEMFESEKSYNESLAFLEQVLSQEPLVKGNPVLVELKTKVPQLKKISDKLLENAKDVFSAATEPSQLNILAVQRMQLLKAFFSLYPDWSTLYTKYLNEEKAKPECFAAIKKHVQQNNTAASTFASFIIQPVQRGPRYAMLISAAISYNAQLPDGHEAKFSAEKVEELKVTQDMVQKLLESSNSATPALNQSQKPYQYKFGDFTRFTINKVGAYMNSGQNTGSTPSQEGTTASSQSSSTSTEQPAKTHKGYSIKGVYKSLWGASSSSATTPSEKNDNKDTPEGDDDFEVVSTTEDSPQQ